MNPMQLMSLIRKCKENPEQAVMGLLSKNTSPVFSNLVKNAKEGNDEEIKKIATNLCSQKGINFEEEFSKFMNGDYFNF